MNGELDQRYKSVIDTIIEGLHEEKIDKNDLPERNLRRELEAAQQWF